MQTKLKQVSYKILLVISIVFSAYTEGYAQLYHVGANKDTLINYRKTADFKAFYAKVFAYNVDIKAKEHIGKIKAISPDRQSGWTFKWWTYNFAERILKDTLSVYSNIDSMELENLPTGCYKVQMSKGNVDTSFYAWIVINRSRFHLVKDDKGYIKYFEATCFKTDIRAIPSIGEKFPDSLRYVHSDNYVLPNPEDYQYNVFQNTPRIIIKGTDGSIYTADKNKYSITNPPSKDTRYFVEFSDKLNTLIRDTVVYKSIIPKAEFSLFISEDTMSEVSTRFYTEKASGEAPLWAKVVSKSQNTNHLTWVLADSIKDPADSVYYFHTANDSIDAISDIPYKYPYKYKLILYAQNDRCTDSISKTLEVVNSKVGEQGANAFPKVFTPNGDGKNDYFSIKSDTIRSIQFLHLFIVDSHGKKVYEYKGKVAQGWKGWDGKTSWGSDAKPGIYYYYFEATGWGPIPKTGVTDPKQIKNSPNKVSGKGYFYLFRDSNN